MGNAERLPAQSRRRPSASACAAGSCATRRRSSWGPKRRRGPSTASSGSAPERLVVVPLAARAAFRPAAPDRAPGSSSKPAGAAHDPRSDRARLGLPERYLVYSGRYDARQDLGSLVGALSRLAGAGRPAGLDELIAWPPRILLIGASPGDRAKPGRRRHRGEVGEPLAYAPALAVERIAGLVAGARAAILPSISEAAGLPAIEALAAGTPVIASGRRATRDRGRGRHPRRAAGPGPPRQGDRGRLDRRGPVGAAAGRRPDQDRVGTDGLGRL